MDDDNPYFLRLKSVARKASLSFAHRGQSIAKAAAGNAYVTHCLKQSKPCLISRIGGSEAVALDEFRKKGALSEVTALRLLNLSGVFPCEPTASTRFCQTYLNAISASDFIGVWGVKDEGGLIRRNAPDAKLCELRALEPYYHVAPWSGSLLDRKVLIIHPFATLIEQQYQNRSCLFEDPQVLPEFQSLTVLPSVQSIGGCDDFPSWNDALHAQKIAINQTDFDVALIGAGAYGLPLGAHVKSLGKHAVQMGGSLQLLFGIKGKRWDTHPIISKLYNDHWVRPGAKERPAAYKKVEGGCYW